MVARVVAALLVSTLALGQEISPAHMYQPKTPETVGYPNWILTQGGKAKLDDAIIALWTEKERLRAENISLQQTTLDLAAKPELTWKGALVLVSVGLVLGASIAIPVAVAVRR
jgi:hypothetical protein